MSIFQLFKRKGTAPLARERLQILLSHERLVVGKGQDLAAELREEILAVVARHVAVDRDHVKVRLDRGAAQSLLEIEVEFPNPAAAERAA